MLDRPFQYHIDETAEEAFNIAWGFLRGGLGSATETQTFLANNIGRQIEGGERNKIRIANRAIHAFETRVTRLVLDVEHAVEPTVG
jgi:hypothetical protein